MYARLGFAIAVHVEPDILLVDEVLAVGDEAFQRRCLDTIEQLRQRRHHRARLAQPEPGAGAVRQGASGWTTAKVRAQWRHAKRADVVRTYLRAVDEETAQRLIAENALQEWLDDDHAHEAGLRPPAAPLGQRPHPHHARGDGGAPTASGWSFRAPGAGRGPH